MKLKHTKQINPHLGKPLKSTPIPPDFILIVDSQEQKPLFTVQEHDFIIVRSLRDGDYSIKGFENKIAIERKQMSDLCSYIGSERQTKTIHKMERFKQIVDNGGFVALVIEASEDDILLGYPMSQLTPEQIRGGLISFEIRYKVHIYYNRSRDCIKRWMLDRMVYWYNIQREVS